MKHMDRGGELRVVVCTHKRLMFPVNVHNTKYVKLLLFSSQEPLKPDIYQMLNDGEPLHGP